MSENRGKQDTDRPTQPPTTRSDGSKKNDRQPERARLAGNSRPALLKSTAPGQSLKNPDRITVDLPDEKRQAELRKQNGLE